MKRKSTFISLAILVSIVLFYVFIPKWIQTATCKELATWYPTFGVLAFYFIRLVLPIAITLSIGILFYLWIIDILSYIKNKVELIKDKFSSNKRGILYIFFFLILVFQFYYNYNYDEFYPAVMMPLFGQGVYTNPIKVETDELVVKNCNEKLDTLKFHELLTEVIGDEEGKMISAKKILQLPLTDNLKIWMNSHAQKQLKESCIKEIQVVKITSEYFYSGHEFRLLRTNKEQLYKIAY